DVEGTGDGVGDRPVGDIEGEEAELDVGLVEVAYRTISDSIAGAFYVVFLGGQIWLWSVWQTRDKAAEKATEIVKSAYGRPLVKQG
ncbi:MAG: hypothetical protein AAFN30_18220, partial [Actinomycetota bacterium]